MAYVQHEHQGNLDTLNKQVGFVRSKVPQIDANTDAIAKLEGAVEIGEERADALQTHMKGVEGKALEAVKAVGELEEQKRRKESDPEEIRRREREKRAAPWLMSSQRVWLRYSCSTASRNSAAASATS